MAGSDQQPSTPAQPAAATPAERTRRFLSRCSLRLADVADSEQAREGTRALTAAIEHAGTAEPPQFEPSWLPVLDSTTALVADPEPTSELVLDLVDLAPALPWVPTHRATDGGTELALAPLDRVLDLGDTIVGLMYVGPGATYPLHHHPPQELYLTIAGHGRWRSGGNEGFEPVEPDRTLYNHPGDLHSAQAGPLPVVALYVLW